MKAFLRDFKEFINRGEAMSVAIGIIIGGALASIAHSFLANIVNPLIAALGSICSTKIVSLAFKIPGTDHTINLGTFLGDIINFLLIALFVFCIIRVFTISQRIAGKAARRIGITNSDDALDTPPEETEETEQTCPYCQKRIPTNAFRCSYRKSSPYNPTSLKPSTKNDRTKH